MVGLEALWDVFQTDANCPTTKKESQHGKIRNSLVVVVLVAAHERAKMATYDVALCSAVQEPFCVVDLLLVARVTMQTTAYTQYHNPCEYRYGLAVVASLSREQQTDVSFISCWHDHLYHGSHGFLTLTPDPTEFVAPSKFLLGNEKQSLYFPTNVWEEK